MEICCPNCGSQLELPQGIEDGRHLQCTECGVKFAVCNGVATVISSIVRPKAIVCGDEPSKHSAEIFYRLSGADEWKNYAWRRWTARFIDFYCGFLFMFLSYSCAGFLSVKTGIGLGFWEWFVRPQNVWFDYVMTTIGAYYFSTIIYVMFGTTLGKKICGLLVANQDGARMAGWDYFIRESRVMFFGEWLCIPLLTAIGQLNQYHMVTNAGLASYDDKWSRENFYTRPTRGKRGYDLVLIVLVLIIGGMMRQLLK